MIGPAGFQQAPKDARSAIEVFHIESGDVVNSIDITGKSDRMIDKLERGLFINMGNDYSIRHVLVPA